MLTRGTPFLVWQVRKEFPVSSSLLDKSAMLLSLERLMPHVAAFRASRACPYPIGLLHGKVRARWAAALKYVLNQSTDPLAVRRQDAFAAREEKLMLRYIARMAGQDRVKQIVQQTDGFWSGQPPSVTKVIAEEGKAKAGEEGESAVEKRLEKLATEVSEIKRLLLEQRSAARPSSSSSDV